MGPSELDMIGRMALAAACGAAVGLERELVEKPAGLRTHALVALGAAAFTCAGFGALGYYTSDSRSLPDVSRIAAQVVSGIGFLGAGIIIFHGDRVRGLTTAAEMWAVAAIGVLSGLGLVLTALAATVMILFVVVGGRPIEHTVDRIRVRRLRRKGGMAGRRIDDEPDSDENGDMDVEANNDGGVAA